MIDLNDVDGPLQEIIYMAEFLHRALNKQVCDDKTKVFSITYDDMNLIDFAICDIDRRVKELQNNIQH